jgi:uncharacterized protein YndB with AHSA1/START domain
MDDVEALLAGMHVDAEITIDAPVEKVWGLVADVTRMGEFSPECHAVEWVDGDVAEVGNRFRGHNRQGEREWARTCTITRLEPPARFAYEVNDDVDGSPASEWSFELSPTEDGGAVLRQRFQHLPRGRTGVAALIEAHPDRAAEIVAGRTKMLSEAMATTLAQMKQTLEG